MKPQCGFPRCLPSCRADFARPPGPGTRARLLEAASLLPLMLRAAKAPAGEVESARRLHAMIRNDRLAPAREIVAMLAAWHPFAAPAPADAPQALSVGAAIHREACAGCHDRTDTDTLLPAENLSRLACSEPPQAFAARLFLGVKGMADQGHRNPFSVEERAALHGWYRLQGGCAKGNLILGVASGGRPARRLSAAITSSAEARDAA
jgi:mono/diheme cytochrome c family protein